MILSELDEATEEVSALKLGYGGGVTIGAVGAAAVGIVVDTIRNIQKLDFDLQVTVTVDTSNTLIRMVQEAKLDFALCRIPDGSDPTPFFYEEIGDEQLSFICRKQHPLATARNITLSQLTDYGLILQHRGTSLRKRVDSLFMSHGFLPPRRVVNSTSTTLSLALVRGTDTLAVLPAAVAALYSANGHYKTLQLKQRFSIDPYGLVRRKDRPLSRSAQNALEIMQHVLAKKREKAT
jgi:DNA-binding transcriptional LysR family regulator